MNNRTAYSAAFLFWGIGAAICSFPLFVIFCHGENGRQIFIKAGLLVFAGSLAWLCFTAPRAARLSADHLLVGPIYAFASFMILVVLWMVGVDVISHNHVFDQSGFSYVWVAAVMGWAPAFCLGIGYRNYLIRWAKEKGNADISVHAGKEGKLNPWMILILMVLVIPAWALIARDPFLNIISGRLPYYILSGQFWAEKFNTIHAGATMDQPTIGKWLIWFTVLSMITFPYVLIVRRMSDRSTRSGYWAYAIPAIILCVLMLSILCYPICMLAQYVHSMGFTPKRLFGLLYGLGGFIFVIWFLSSAFRPETKLPAK